MIMKKCVEKYPHLMLTVTCTKFKCNSSQTGVVWSSIFFDTDVSTNRTQPTNQTIHPSNQPTNQATTECLLYTPQLLHLPGCKNTQTLYYSHRITFNTLIIPCNTLLQIISRWHSLFLCVPFFFFDGAFPYMSRSISLSAEKIQKTRTIKQTK